MKRFLVVCAAIIVFLCSFSEKSYASHAMGAELLYECVGQDSFLITLNLYRDCDGIDAFVTDAPITISGCGNSFPFNLLKTPNIHPGGFPNTVEISPICASQIGNTTCNSGPLPGAQYIQYSAIWVAPSACNWRLSFDLNSRNLIITTITNPVIQDLYVESYLNNAVAPCNSSPTFSNYPVQYYCFQDTAIFSHGSIDADGDSLVYHIVPPMVDSNMLVQFVNGFSVSNPLNTNNTFTIDTITGQISFVPQTAHIGIVAVRVDEYRNGQLIGSVMRDMQIVVLGSPFCNPPYGQNNLGAINVNSVSGGVLTAPYNLQSCVGDTLRFAIGAKGNGIILYSNIATALPGATFDTIRVNADSITGLFTWPIIPAYAGIRTLTVFYGTTSCPLYRISSQPICIKIIQGTYAGTDQVFCDASQPVYLIATGGSSFQWSPSVGLSDASIATPIATPTATTDYIVTGNLSGSCRISDTVRVTVVPSFNLNILPSNDTINICNSSSAALDLQLDNAFAPYTVSWSPSDSLSNNTIPNPIAFPSTATKYVVSATSALGCKLQDSVVVNVPKSSPKITLEPYESIVCNGTNVQLTALAASFDCGPTSSANNYCGPNNAGIIRSYGTGNNTMTSGTAFNGSYNAGKFQVIYRASDLRAQGFKAGTITSMQLTVISKRSTDAFRNLSISLACTDAPQANRLEWFPYTTEVYFEPSYITRSGVNTFALSQPYNWDGVSNLVVQICHGDSSGRKAGSPDYLKSSYVDYPASINNITSTTSYGCNMSTSGIFTLAPFEEVPNISFTICSGPSNYSYQWSPTTGLSNPNIANPVATPSQSTTYTVSISDSNCTYTRSANLTVKNFNLTVSNDTSFCGANSVQLLANNGGLVFNPCDNNGNGCIGTNSTVSTVGIDTYANTDSTFPAPFANRYESVKQQYLYKASELIAAGVTPGRLSAISYNVKTYQGTRNYANFSVKIKCSNITTLTSGSPEVGNFLTVFTPKNVNIPTTGWEYLGFDNSLDWDGTSNLVVEICFNNDIDPNLTTSTTKNTLVNSSYYGYMASTWYAMNNGDACNSNINLVTNKGASNLRPNTRFFICEPETTSTYTWSPSNTLSSSNIANPVATPTTTTTYTVTATAANGCTKTKNVTIQIATGSSAAEVNITSDVPPCAGGTATFTAHPTFAGSNPIYQWKLNGNNVGTNSPTLTLSNMPANQVVSCILTSNLTCLSNATAVSNNITISNVGAITSVSITSSSSPPCAGPSISFTAQPVNGGINPSYQWKVNGINVSGNSSTIVLNGLLAGDEVSAILVSSDPCVAIATAVSNTIVVVASYLPEISISAGSTGACAGTVNFTAQAQNGGSAPSYQWKLNGVNVGINLPTITLNGLLKGDKVSCILYPDIPCPSTPTVTSNTITIQDIITTGITISSQPSACAYEDSIIFSSIANTGNRPIYQWKLNGNNVGTDIPQYILQSPSLNDIVTCEITATGDCLTALTATSNSITITTCTSINETDNILSFTVQPNPSSGIFFLNLDSAIESNWDITVYDIAGKEILNQNTEGSLQQYPIDLSSVGKSMYILKVSNGVTQGHQRLVVH